MSKNDSEMLRQAVVASTGNTQSKTLDGITSVKILNEKVYDTSSSEDAFSGLSAGDVIKMEGWNYAENNRIFTVTEVESGGQWIKVDKQLIDEKEADVPSAGVTMYNTPESLTVSGCTVDDVLVEVVNMNAAASSPEEADRDYFAITAADTVSTFALLDAGDSLLISWAKMSEG
jgi:hypothetical protein